ncbi:hypothetical protein ThvES_00015400 [Thiovulum sp. ES]|nr:hypothetical protein ThvES_00015400 [Thiovulum sp. ES]
MSMEKLTEKEQVICNYLAEQNLVGLEDVQKKFEQYSKQEVIYLLEQMKEKKYLEIGQGFDKNTKIILIKEAREFIYGEKNQK